MREAATIFRLTRGERWRCLVLPGIFPYLITGLVTASGGAWNASIVAEYFRFKGQTISTVGLGATISRATDTGNFNLLLAATCVMAAIVVVINRTFGADFMFWAKPDSSLRPKPSDFVYPS